MFLSCLLWLFRACARKRPIEEDVMETSLSRCLCTWHLTLYGLGAMSGGIIFGGTVVIFSTMAGPSTFIGCMLAGICAFFNGMCYAELASHFPKAGSAYIFTYLSAGELLAFLVGWTMILEYVIQAVMSAVGASLTLDVMCDGAIKAGIIHVFGKYPDTNGVLASYPDLIAAGLILLFVIILCTGAKSSVGVTNVGMIATAILMLVAMVLMCIRSHGMEYLREPLHGGFAPFGVTGIFSAAGVAFNSFNGFDAISISGEEAQRPRITIPKSMNLSVMLMIVLLTVFSFLLASYVPWYEVDPEGGLTAIFAAENIPWLKYLTGVSAIIGYMTNSLCSLYAVPRIAYSLAQDGLLFPFFGYVHPRTQVPLFSILVFGALSVCLALTLNFLSLAKMLSVGSLLCFTAVAAVTLNLRYTRPELFVQRQNRLQRGKWVRIDVEKDVGRLYPTFRSWFPAFLDRCSPGVAVAWIIWLFVALSVCLVLALLKGLPLIVYHDKLWLAPIVIFVILVFAFNAFLLLSFRFQQGLAFYSLPGFPYTPCLAILLNLCLLVDLSGMVWVRLLVWSVIGLLIYLLYGVWNSRLNSAFGHVPHPLVDSSFGRRLFTDLNHSDVYPQQKNHSE